MPNHPSPTPYVPPTKKDWDTLFQPMFDEYFNPLPSVASSVLAVVAPEPTDVHLSQLQMIKMHHPQVLHKPLKKHNLQLSFRC
ncbi:hypothetical protein Tco_1396206, partial [Tanacetum coccineum]